MAKKPKALAKAKAAVAKHDKDIKAKNKRVAETNEVNRDLGGSRLYSGQSEVIYPDLHGKDVSVQFQGNTRPPGAVRPKGQQVGVTEVGDGPDPLLGNEHLSIKKRGESMGTE